MIGDAKVVRQGRRPHGLRGVHRPPDVRDHHRRVRGSLDVHQAGLGSDGLFPSPGLTRIHERRCDAEARQETCKNLRGRGVQARSGDHVVAGVHGREDRGGNRAHPGTRDEGGVTTLQVRERIFEVAERRVPPSGVIRFGRRRDGKIGALARGFQLPRRTRVDRCDDRAVALRTPAVNRAGSPRSRSGGVRRNSFRRICGNQIPIAANCGSVRDGGNNTGKVKKGGRIRAVAWPQRRGPGLPKEATQCRAKWTSTQNRSTPIS